MSKIQLKQNKRDTLVDLSQEDIASEAFLDNFKSFADETCDFLKGTSISLILPEEQQKFRLDTPAEEIEQIREESNKKLEQVINQLQTELNKRNISLKAYFRVDNFDEAVSTVEAQNQKEEEDNKKETNFAGLPDTLYVKANLRSGQLIRYPGNVFVFGDVNPSAEIIASGDIIVWGTLRGIAHAGCEGDDQAKIGAIKIDCGQLRISDKFIALQQEIRKKRKKEKNISPEIVEIVDNEVKIRSAF